MNANDKNEEQGAKIELKDLDFAIADPLALWLQQRAVKPWQTGLISHKHPAARLPSKWNCPA